MKRQATLKPVTSQQQDPTRRGGGFPVSQLTEKEAHLASLEAPMNAAWSRKHGSAVLQGMFQQPVEQDKTQVALLTLHDADVYIQEHLKDLIGNLQGEDVAAKADLRFIPNDEFERLLAEKEPPQSPQDRVRLRTTMGFVQEDADSKIVWIRESQRDGTVLIHEALHVYANANWKGWKRTIPGGQAIDEGTTEYFTRKIAKALNLKGIPAYNKWVLAVEHLVALTSEQALADAFFSGNLEAWESGLQRSLGGSLYPWFDLVQNENVGQASLLVPVPTSSNNDSAPSPSVSASGSKSSLLDGMRKHMASKIRAVAEEKDLEKPLGLQAWDELVTGAGQNAHAAFADIFGPYAVLGAARYFARRIEPSAGEGKGIGEVIKAGQDAEEAIKALVKATSEPLVARAFLGGEIEELLKAHPNVEDQWAYQMKRGWLGLSQAIDAFD